ncbi:iron-sulfur cluster assembly protein, partial [Paracoccus sphaerophysae]
MATQADVMQELAQIAAPGGRSLVEADLVRALTVTGDEVRFVLEAPDAIFARELEPARAEAERRLRALGFQRVNIVTTAPAGRAPSVAAQSGQGAGP